MLESTVWWYFSCIVPAKSVLIWPRALQPAHRTLGCGSRSAGTTRSSTLSSSPIISSRHPSDMAEMAISAACRSLQADDVIMRGSQLKVGGNTV